MRHRSLQSQQSQGCCHIRHDGEDGDEEDGPPPMILAPSELSSDSDEDDPYEDVE